MKKLLSGLFALAVLAGALALPHQAHATDIALDGNLRGGCSTTNATSNAATLNNKCGVITSESLTTTAGSDYVLTLTNSVATTTDIVLWSAGAGTTTAGVVTPGKAEPGSGTIVFQVKNSALSTSLGGAAAFNGTIKIRYFIIKP